MVLSKSWFDNAIRIYTKSRDDTFDSIKLARYNGILEGLNLAYAELIKPPGAKSESSKKEINIEKGYETIVKYYMNNDAFIIKYPDENIRKQKANEIAMKKMDEQQLRIA